MKLLARISAWFSRPRERSVADAKNLADAKRMLLGTTDTEFSAEVVQVSAINPHPNADRLEVAGITMASGPTTYEVVVQKGSFRVGDLAAYFSVDCLLPTTHPAFAFLTTRLDGAGKAVYRLRAARLRGVFSQGLLVPAPAGTKLGEGVAEAFGVQYHCGNEPAGRGPNLSMRKSKAQPMPVYAVESLKKVPRLISDDEPVVVTEKIHGTNFRFGWVPRKILGVRIGWRFMVGSHRVIKKGQDNHFYEEDVWTTAAERMRLAEKTKAYRGLVFFGELYGHTYTGQRIQDLTYGRKPEDGPGLACFDVHDGSKWLSFGARREILDACDLRAVPILRLGLAPRADIERLAEGTSELDGATQREGVVVEALDGVRRKAKYVGTGYLLRKSA